MNATVTKKSAKKSATTSNKKAATKSAAKKPIAKPATKVAAKKVAKPASKPAKKVAVAAKPASKVAKKTTKAAPGKKAAPPATKTAKKVANKITPKTVAKPVVKKVKPTEVKISKVKAEKSIPNDLVLVKTDTTNAKTQKVMPHVVQTVAIETPKKPDYIRSTESDTHNSMDNAMTGLTSRIEQAAVSKASKVATKTIKSPSDNAPVLTEAQILKMSDKDYMNEAQLAFFKVRLQQLEIELLKNAGETTEHLRETVLVPDPADRATIEEEHALELRTRDRERKLLKKVQQSLASIESGEYGWCEETGEPIGIPRLLARPTATLSLEAQQRRELKQKLYGD
jgi:DnaK suppressor protein